MLKKIIFLFIFLPFFVFAKIEFNEIMFDPKGADSGREWIEIKNNNNFAIDLKKWKFCVSGRCHFFYSEPGKNFKIPPNSYGILTKKIENFKKEYKNFSGFILKVSFSLKNTKEKLELKNNNEKVVSMVEYNSLIGGKNGDTFSLFNNIWKNGKATPNAKNKKKEKEQKTKKKKVAEETNNENKIKRTYVEISDEIGGKKKIKAEIIDNIPDLIVGAENNFIGRAYGITGIEIKGAEYFWNFGDGEIEEGKNTRHTYLSPGKYILSLIVKSDKFMGNDRKIVNVIKSKIKITEVDYRKNWIKLKNEYKKILKLDNWIISVNKDEYKIPKETYILGNQEIIFHNKITNLDFKKNSQIFLFFPNGEISAKYIWNKMGPSEKKIKLQL